MRKSQQFYLEIKQRVSDLELQLEKLTSENVFLKNENNLLKTENEKLKDRLGLNSKNSSIPSSKELFKIKYENKTKSSKNIGGQTGHKGHVRDKMVADEIVKVELASIECECGGIIGISSKPHIHQKIEIPEIKPHVTEYHMQKGRCRVCGKRKSTTLPEGVTQDLFGPRVKSIISSLSGFYKNSKREVESILKDVFGLQISLGSISNNEARVAKECKEAYEDIELELSYSKILHIDETSHYNKGKLGWCWMFTSTNSSLLKLTDSRGKKVLENSVFGSSDNIIVTDRYGAYGYFDSENRQLCWSHLARDFERFGNSSNAAVRIVGENLRRSAYEVFDTRKMLFAKEIDVLEFLGRAGKLRKRMWECLQEIADLETVVHASRVAKNMMKAEGMMWKFLEDPVNIPMTNNHAERQIRHYVTYRKNSYFTQSDRGNRFLERLISLFLTWKQRKCNPVQNLQNLLTC